jgi:hypothetical protein
MSSSFGRYEANDPNRMLFRPTAAKVSSIASRQQKALPERGTGRALSESG